MKQLKSITSINERDYCTRGELPSLIGVGQWTCDKLIKQAKAGARIDGRMIVDVKKIKDYINEITEESQEEGGTMKSSELKELRCTCGRLLGKSNSETEIVCPRCRNLMVFDNGKLINGVVVCK